MFRDKKDQVSDSPDAIRRALGNPEWLLGVRSSTAGQLTVVVDVDPADAERNETRRIEIEARLMNLDGIDSVNVVMTSEKAAEPTAAAPPRPLPGQQSVKRRPRLSPEAQSQGQPQAPSAVSPIPGIARILVVASAKGGVGKSTVSVNLAAAFAKQGLKVGLLDADIYGPSIPTMLGQTDAQPQTGPSGKLEPVIAHGIRTLSIGYLTDPDAPMIWRGPMVQSAITQMLNDAAWGTPQDPLDLLIIDTPPGTGEAQLTLAQKVPVDAAILVTTPQQVALADVRRGAAMFEKTHIAVLGVVETMSWFEDAAGGRHALLGEGGGRRIAGELGLQLLKEIPILQDIRQGGDDGVPAVIQSEPAETVFFDLAKSIALSLDALQTKTAPTITFVD